MLKTKYLLECSKTAEFPNHKKKKKIINKINPQNMHNIWVNQELFPKGRCIFIKISTDKKRPELHTEQLPKKKKNYFGKPWKQEDEIRVLPKSLNTWKNIYYINNIDATMSYGKMRQNSTERK